MNKTLFLLSLFTLEAQAIYAMDNNQRGPVKPNQNFHPYLRTSYTVVTALNVINHVSRQVVPARAAHPAKKSVQGERNHKENE